MKRISGILLSLALILGLSLIAATPVAAVDPDWVTAEMPANSVSFLDITWQPPASPVAENDVKP